MMFSKVVAIMLLSVSTAEGNIQKACPAGRADRSLQFEEFDTAIISNGLVKLGLYGTANLAIYKGTPDFYDRSDTGLRIITGTGKELEAVAIGCFCEGWGASAEYPDGEITVGSANVDDGPTDMGVYEFSSTKDTATSTVFFEKGDIYVTHDFVPAPETPNLYRIEVTLTNYGNYPVTNVRYRRVVDFDVPPNVYDECISIDTVTDTESSDLEYASDDGFQSANPLEKPEYINIECKGPGCEVFDDGPDDHGVMFDLLFKEDDGKTPLTLKRRESVTFYLYYGAALTRDKLINAFDKVGAEAYSYADSCLFREGDGDLKAIYGFGYARNLCEIDSFYLWDIQTQKRVGALGGGFNMCDHPRGVSIEAVPLCGDVDKVKFELLDSKGKQVYRINEGNAPYQLGTDIDEPYRVKAVSQLRSKPGKYTLKATATFFQGRRKQEASETFWVDDCGYY